MKRVTITLDDASLEQLEVLNYCLGASKSKIIRRALDAYRDEICNRWPSGYQDACDMYCKAKTGKER